MIDSHCHLADEVFADDLDAVIARARTAGLSGALCILSAGDGKESAAAARVRALWPEVRFTVGIHPHKAGEFAGRLDEARALVRQGVIDERARAIGEIGLDYHYDFSPRDVQQAVFRAQVRLALDLGAAGRHPHPRGDDDTFGILREAGPSLRGVFHCFTGDTVMARAALDLGFYISLAGIVTFPRAESLRDVATLVPADRLLDRDRQPVSGAGAAPRQAERAGVRGARGRAGCGPPRRHGVGPRRPGGAELRRLVDAGRLANCFPPNGLAR